MIKHNVAAFAKQRHSSGWFRQMVDQAEVQAVIKAHKPTLQVKSRSSSME